jgi:precorrin-3B methylase
MNRGAIDLPRVSYQTHLRMTANFSEVLIEVWRQALVDKADTVRLGSESYKVTQSKAKRLRQVEFVFEGKTIIGIQQNPNTKSRWAKEARSGKLVMQFIEEGRYVAVVSAGKVTMYGKRGQ